MSPTHDQRKRRQAMWLAGFAVTISTALSFAPTSRAQYAINPQVNTNVLQDGRLLDANPSLYGGRLNSGRLVSPLVGGNPYASGLVGRGLSLRSYSPISDPSTFQGPLGSGSLYAFRRDSVSVADAGIPLVTGSLAQPYYDPATTVVSPGLLRGLTTPSGPQPAARSAIPRIDLRLPVTSIQMGLNAQVRAPYADPATATTSSIFGPPTVPRLPLPLESTEAPPWERPPGDDLAPREPEREPRPLDRFPEETRAAMTPLDLILRGEPAQLGLTEPGRDLAAWARSPRPGERPPGLVLPEPVPSEPRRAELTPPRVTDASVLPGFDVFNDMRLALALQADPGADWFREMQKAAEGRPELLTEPAQAAAQGGEDFVTNMLNAPLRTFTGRGASLFNDQMLKAESLMAIGHYFEAADRYAAAERLEPANPLPLLGRGHALLAAGDYRSAAALILRGIERFPDVTRFALDLKTLLGSGEAIDIRRADIMHRLEQADSPPLLFLLGYIEYHTGDRERGLATLERAARHPQAGPVIARYPDMLRGQGALPPPRYEPAVPADDGPALQVPPRPRPSTPEPPEPLVVPPPVEER